MVLGKREHTGISSLCYGDGPLEEKTLTTITILCHGDGLWNERTHRDLILLILPNFGHKVMLRILIKIHITKVIMFSHKY